MNRSAIAEVLNRDDVRSLVMKDGAFFEAFLGVAIGLYFTSSERMCEFHELVVSRLTFEERIRTIEKLPFKKSYKSVAALPVIRQVQQARNIIAHEYFVWQGTRRIQNAQWSSLFADYPDSYRKPVALARQRILRLTGTKEFLELRSK